jgi:hypothetical protein
MANLKRIGFFSSTTTPALGTTNATLYTAPLGSGSGPTAVVRSIHICNTTTSPASITLALNGSAATATNCFMYQFTVPALGLLVENINIVLNSNDTIQGLQGTAAALTLTISGVEL